MASRWVFSFELFCVTIMRRIEDGTQTDPWQRLKLGWQLTRPMRNNTCKRRQPPPPPKLWFLEALHLTSLVWIAKVCLSTRALCYQSSAQHLCSISRGCLVSEHFVVAPTRSCPSIGLLRVPHITDHASHLDLNGHPKQQFALC